MDLVLKTALLLGFGASLGGPQSAPRAQHCGGPCEIPRGANPVAASAKYGLTAGKSTKPWQYLFNWVWTEDNKAKHSLEAVLSKQPLRDFGYRRMFVSPAGNGVLVTGNAYSSKHSAKATAPLFVFLSPTGDRLVEIPLKRALTPDEQRLGKCPGCDCCRDILYVFAKDPKLSQNRCFVELTAHKSERRIGFFLPLGLPVFNRRKFDAALARAEWNKFDASRRKALEQELEGLVARLISGKPANSKRAADALEKHGYLALAALRQARANSSSDEVERRIAQLVPRLRPWRSASFEAMSIDLDLLVAFLSYPDKDVRRAVAARLEALVPAIKKTKAKDRAAWIAKRRAKLAWNASKRHYELR